MSTDTIIQFRPLQPGGDLVYVQTPRQDGTLHVEAEDSWDLAEEKAKQQQAEASTGVDDKRSSSSSASAMISSASTDSSNDDSSDNSSGSSLPAAAGTASNTATSSTTQTAGTGTAASGANRMNAAVPANADLRARLRANIRAYHCCAFVSTVLLGAGAVFTLLAMNVIQHRDSGYVYPEEIEFDKVMAGIWYGAAAIAGGIGITNAVYHHRRGNL